jgi:glycosyltransferase involved in cell wall biosynthesis
MTKSEAIGDFHRTLVVIPAWNEAPSIGVVIREVQKNGFQVLVVDDGSLDGTAAEATAHGALVVSLPFNLGVGAALRCGFRFAVQTGYDIVVQCDADGQHPTDHIEHLINEIASSKAHMVIGSRFAHKGPTVMRVSFMRRIAMRMLSLSASRATGTRITDSTSGFRAIRQPLLGELAQKISPYYLGDTYEAVVSAGRAGYLVREIYAPIWERMHGESSARPLTAARKTLKVFLSVILNVTPPIQGPEASSRR